MQIQEINESDLINVKKGENLPLETDSLTNKVTLWVCYDSPSRSYLLVKRSYDENMQRHDNHVIFEGFLLSDFRSEITEIFKEAIKIIETRRCFTFQRNKTFQEKHCTFTH